MGPSIVLVVQGAPGEREGEVAETPWRIRGSGEGRRGRVLRCAAVGGQENGEEGGMYKGSF